MFTLCPGIYVVAKARAVCLDRVCERCHVKISCLILQAATPSERGATCSLACGICTGRHICGASQMSSARPVSRRSSATRISAGHGPGTGTSLPTCRSVTSFLERSPLQNVAKIYFDPLLSEICFDLRNYVMSMSTTDKGCIKPVMHDCPPCLQRSISTPFSILSITAV